MMLLKLFWSFLQVGMFSFGGGLAALPLIKNEMVDVHGWLTLAEFTDLITIAEMTPGPIAINAATFVGIMLAGWPGAIIATLGCITPSVILVSLLAMIYKRYKKLTIVQGILSGLRPAVIALIASAGLSILLLAFWGESGLQLTLESLRSINVLAVILFSIGFAILRKWKPSPIFIILGSGAIGGILYLLPGL